MEQSSANPPGQLSPDDQRRYRRLVQIFIGIYILLVVMTAGLFAFHRGQASKLSAGVGADVPVYNGIQSQARNSKRQTDIQSLQTQIEAFFSQNGYYPSLTDMNSASWRLTNMKSLDPNSLVDPESSCDPSSAACLVASPSAGSYAYAVTNSSGQSCEADDTQCAQYTLTATYEGTVNGETTYAKSNLD